MQKTTAKSTKISAQADDVMSYLTSVTKSGITISGFKSKQVAELV